MVGGLQRRPGPDMDDTADWSVVTFGRLAKVHRERSGEHDEGLLLLGVHVAPTACSWLVASKVRASVLKARQLGELRDVARGFFRIVRASLPREPARQNHVEGHAVRVARPATESIAGAVCARDNRKGSAKDAPLNVAPRKFSSSLSTAQHETT